MGPQAWTRHYPKLVMKPLVLALALAFAVDAAARDPIASAALAPARETRPQAPPLPFRYVGRLLENGKQEALVMRGGVLHSISVGDEIDGEYRVDRISGSTISFTYLPLKTKQDLAL